MYKINLLYQRFFLILEDPKIYLNPAKIKIPLQDLNFKSLGSNLFLKHQIIILNPKTILQIIQDQALSPYIRIIFLRIFNISTTPIINKIK